MRGAIPGSSKRSREISHHRMGHVLELEMAVAAAIEAHGACMPNSPLADISLGKEEPLLRAGGSQASRSTQSLRQRRGASLERNPACVFGQMRPPPVNSRLAIAGPVLFEGVCSFARSTTGVGILPLGPKLLRQRSGHRIQVPLAAGLAMAPRRIDDPPAALHHRAISANTPQPRYSRVYVA